jgi:uncharacterized iron-regulated protein
MEQSVSLTGEDFERMKQELMDKFMKEYEGAKME